MSQVNGYWGLRSGEKVACSVGSNGILVLLLTDRVSCYWGNPVIFDNLILLDVQGSFYNILWWPNWFAIIYNIVFDQGRRAGPLLSLILDPFQILSFGLLRHSRMTLGHWLPFPIVKLNPRSRVKYEETENVMKSFIGQEDVLWMNLIKIWQFMSSLFESEWRLITCSWICTFISRSSWIPKVVSCIILLKSMGIY